MVFSISFSFLLVLFLYKNSNSVSPKVSPKLKGMIANYEVNGKKDWREGLIAGSN